MLLNSKNLINLIFFVFLLLVSTSPIKAEEKATQWGLSTEEWLNCIGKVSDEIYGSEKGCWQYRDPVAFRKCEKRMDELNKAIDKEIARRCVAVPKGKSPSPNPTEQPTQDQSSDNNPSKIPNYTQALVENSPKERDFQKVSKSDFKKVNPVSTASATPKPATQSANITGSIFIGKIGSEGELILQLPDGKEVKLTEDKSAFEGERPYSRWRDLIGTGQSYVTPKRNIYIEEIDCHILLEQERRDQESLQRLGAIRYASEWGVDETIIVKPTGNCTYLNEGGPVRVLAGEGQVTFKTPGGASVSAGNADFGIGYNAKSATSIVEVYNGSITVKNKAGSPKTISAVYGSQIKQIEVDKNGVMSEKIAIPQSQWQAFLASKQEKKDETKGNILLIVGAVAVFGLGGVVFFLYQTGKLLLLYQIASQKITEILKKISKAKETD